MSHLRLFIVRHGQASYGEANYDRLSALGEKQSRLLGGYWAERGVEFDRAYVGPCRRHRQTYEAVAAECHRLGRRFPEATPAPGLNEYPAFEVMGRAAPQFLREHPEIEKAMERAASDPVELQRVYFRMFRGITRGWVRGEIITPGLETWPAFRARVASAVELMREPAGNGAGRPEMAVAFASGGPVSAAVGHCLGLSDEKTMELSWIVANGSFTEFLATAERFSLVTFNAIPHLDSPELVTGA